MHFLQVAMGIFMELMTVPRIILSHMRKQSQVPLHTRMLLAPPCPIKVWSSNHFRKWTKKYLGAKGVVLLTLVSDLPLALEVVKQF
jgi:hypothetical protein